MNTEQFLRLVLPAAGLKILAELVEVQGRDKPGWRYSTYQSFEAMAEAAMQIDAKGRTVYHACNGFGDWHPHAKNPARKQIRDQGNVVACRALYDDIDTGKPGAYADRKEAGTAIKAFINATGLPKPTLISSGGGIHLYWAFSEDTTPAIWQRLANKKRLVTQHFGLKIDTACDLDSARVLRPVGTTWRKREERPVTCILESAPTTPEAVEAALDAYLAANEITPAPSANAVPDWMKAETGNLEGQGIEYPPSFMGKIAEHCQQIRIFKSTGGEDEPIWHAFAGIAKFCADGETVFHEWSSEHDGYVEAEAQEKLDNWTAGPTTCEKFKKLSPTGCQGCKHSCKSPIALGIDITVDVVPTVEVVEVAATPEAPEQKGFVPPEFWPQGFSFDKKTETIYTFKEDEEGVPHRVNVAAPLFYVVGSIQQEDGTSALLMERVIRGKRTRFEIETKHTGDAKSLRMQLAAYRIVTMSQNDLHYLVNQQQLANQKSIDETNTYKQLGWQHDNTAFLIGSKLITKDGSNPVRVGKAINSDLCAIGIQKGNAESWVSGVDALYNRDNAEPYQLAICLAFGGIFGPLMPSAQWNGIPYALTSDDTGYGKSTVCKIGLNIYCPSFKTVVEDSTPKGIPIRTSAMGNLPFLLDEVTKYVVEASDMSDMLYALSNGNTRIGAKSDGTERDRLPGWNVPVLITGNRNIMHHVTEHNLNPAATQARVFEVDLESYPRLATLDKLSPEYKEHGSAHKDLTDSLISSHYGVIGEEWIRWVINNSDEVREKLDTVGRKMRQSMYGGDASKERFYYDLATLMLVGGYFARKLGYIKFDLNNLKSWIVKHVASLRVASDENKSTPEDLFGQFMSDLNGHLLVTNRFDGSDRRSATTVEMDQGNVRGAVAGRVVMGTEDERPRVYVAIREVTKWCAKNGVQYTKFKRDLMAEHLIRTGTPGCNKTSGAIRMNIGKGVVAHEHLGRVNCLEFDAKAAQKHLANPAPVTVIHEETVAA